MMPAMPQFPEASAVSGGAGRYVAELAPDWFVWGPMGGYIAAIAFRAMAAETAHPAPATFACQFLRAGQAGSVEIAVESVRGGKRSEALRAVIAQGGKPLLSATSWFVAGGMTGFEHTAGAIPKVPDPDALRPYSELSDDYADWFPIWRHLEGRPVRWEYAPGPPIWQTWMKLVEPPPRDPILDAARMLLWADLLPWNACQTPHDWPRRWIAPNLDLTVTFHAPAGGEEWILCDAESPSAGEGLAGGVGRLWTRSGKLVATSTAQLFCVENPRYEEELAKRRAFEAESGGR
jgi:acyl-CoA thioesterase II